MKFLVTQLRDRKTKICETGPLLEIVTQYRLYFWVPPHTCSSRIGKFMEVGYIHTPPRPLILCALIILYRKIHNTQAMQNYSYNWKHFVITPPGCFTGTIFAQEWISLIDILVPTPHPFSWISTAFSVKQTKYGNKESTKTVPEKYPGRGNCLLYFFYVTI